MKIAFQGRHGAYGESAAYHLYGHQIEAFPVDHFEDIYRLIASGEMDGGVIPIENSTAGSILENYDLLLQYKIPIVGEVKLQISHVLMAAPGATLETLREVYSHPQALAQCTHFFADHPQIQAIPYFDTAGAAERLAQQPQVHQGAIASQFAAEFHHLNILQTSLENHKGENYTRFFAIQTQPKPCTDGVCKSSIAFTADNNAGSLFHALGCFANRHINLIRIESRPRKGMPWEYVFYMDFLGNPHDSAVQDALEELHSLCSFVVHLGTYPPGENRSLMYQEK